MKKSEKIEVRVSLDEKQKLSDIAESEGRSVSELIRGLIERYMALSNPIGARMPLSRSRQRIVI
ncbi:ribbon-helix-helix protein, CopG family [Fretibacter rubidus]|uniref:plasmid mobilization protein n=1 Tax=Fretibacter rubidus TaxID=570162 RepID=UPI003529D685